VGTQRQDAFATSRQGFPPCHFHANFEGETPLLLIDYHASAHHAARKANRMNDEIRQKIEEIGERLEAIRGYL
jgi:hypothetical protein